MDQERGRDLDDSEAEWRTIDVEVGFDEDAQVYYVLSSDLPGLHIEMPTFEGLVEVALDAAPDLLDPPRQQRTRLNFQRVIDLAPSDGR